MNEDILVGLHPLLVRYGVLKPGERLTDLRLQRNETPGDPHAGVISGTVFFEKGDDHA